MAPIIETRQLCHVYGAGTPFEHIALDHVDFRVERGEFLGIIGHTGSGKSTLIQHLNGLLKPTSGQILIDGEDLHQSKEFLRKTRFRVGLVFQYPEYQLFEETVYKDIAFGPRNMGLSDREIDRRVREAAGFVGIPEDALQKSPFDLSGGQKRRVAIAGVIAMEPEVLILDEPTAGLDPRGSAEILQNIEDFRKAHNAAIVMVSHSMEDVARLTDRIVVMNDCHAAMEGTASEIFAHADQLISMGLDVPQITRLFLRLRELGMDVDPSVYTVEQAMRQLLPGREGVC
ncbi:MAG: energy-coupling factor transporter ATPase [Oscillospiraceae bacterium]|nr:energy-coupling factor transporter ATPase [Oscillospiraceae bacterium]